MRSEVYQPPLNWWGYTWRVLAMLAVSGLTFGTRASYQWDHARWLLFVDLALGVAAFLAVWWRRRFPVTLAVVLTVAAVASGAAAGPATLAFMSVATRRRWLEIVPVAVLGFVCGLLSEQYVVPPGADGDPSVVVTLGANAVFTAAMIAWGMYVGSRRELLMSLRVRADLAEEQQASRISEAQALERARIAREMHDVLAHRISVVSMYAGALAFRDDLPPQQVRDTAKTIQDNAHRAMTELREVLGVLREGPGDAAPEAPQHDLGDIERLVADARAAGMTVAYDCAVDAEQVPAAIGRTLYRSVQEGLTNARKHARGTAVAVQIWRTSDEPRGDGVAAKVSNPRPVGNLDVAPPPSGLGLIGLAERVALLGGTQSAQQASDEFVLQVWLPWQP